MPFFNVTVLTTGTVKTFNLTIADNIQHGTVTTNSTTVAYDYWVYLTVTPDTGYMLASLSYTPAGGSPVAISKNANGEYIFRMPAADATVSAEFTPNYYTVSFDANGGEGEAMAAQTFTYDEAKSLTANTYTRTGYDFAGWNTVAAPTTENPGTVYTDVQEVQNLTAEANGTVTLYAQWTPHTYAVSFDANGGEGEAMANQSFTYDEAAKALTANTYTRTGYDFAGWNTVAAPTEQNPGTTYTNGQEVQNLTAEANGTVTLYAQWTPHDYSITIAGTSNGTVTAKVGETENATTAHYNDPVTLTVAPATGYELDTLTVTGVNSNPVTVTNNQFTMPAGNVTVTATFKVIPHAHSFSYSAEGATITAICSADNCPLTNHQATLTIAAPTGDLTYDGTGKAATITDENSIQGSATVSYQKKNGDSWGDTSTAPTDAGTYKASITMGEGNGAATASMEYTIAPKPVTITGLSASNKEYDGTTDVTVIGTAAIDGLVHNDAVTVTAGSAAFDNANVGMGKTVSFTDYSLSGEAAGNYTLSAQPASVTASISKAPLTVTAKPKTITYGDASANDGVSYSGFVTGESESNLGGSLAFAYSYVQYGNVGNYTITPSGLTADNYEISYVAGTLTVEPKEVGLTWSNTSLNYNGQEQAPTAEATGTVNNDQIGVTVRGGKTNAGTNYTAAASALTGDKADNYKLPAANTTAFSIAKAVNPASVINTASVKVGGNTVDLSANISNTQGLISYAITGALEGCSLDAGTGVFTSGTTTGECIVTVTIAEDNNYSGTSATITVTVTAKATQTISFAEATVSKTYGDADFTVTASQTVGDGAVTYSITGDVATVDSSTGAVHIVKAGKATITATAAETSDFASQTTNYTLTVNPKSVMITGLGAENKTYDGTINATVTGMATIDGLVNNDTVTVTAGSTAFDNANVGTGKTVTFTGYSLSGEAAGNYTLSAQPADTTANITARAITIAATAQSVEVGGSIAAGTNKVSVTIGSLVDGHSISEVTLTGDTSTVTDNGTITPSAAIIKDASDNNVTNNYSISYTAGALTVTNVQVYISGVKASNKTYDGGTSATVTGTAGLKKVSDDSEVSSLSITGNITAAFADKNVGTGKAVTITAATLSDATNYTLNIAKSNEKLGLTANITAKSVTITGVTATTRDYVPNDLTVTLSGGAVNDVETSDTVTVDLTNATGTMADANAGENKAVTVSGVKLGGTAAGNYALSAQPTDVTVTINKAANPATITETASVMRGGNTVDLKSNITLNGATGTVSYVISGEANGCSMNGSVLTSGNNTGTLIVNVTVAEDANYNALSATPITVTITDKKIQTITASAVTAIYGDTGKKIEATTSGDGALSYAVKSGDAVTVDDSGNLTIVKASSAVITVTAAETTTYAQATKDVNVTVNTKAMTVSAENINVTVDGQPHGITVNVTDPATGYTVKYGTEAGSYTLDASPTQTEVGMKTVYYQVTADNYTTYTGSVKVTISAKFAQAITAADVTATYGETDKKIEASTTGDGTLSYAVKSGDAVTVNETTGALTIVKAGSAVITVTTSETATYTQATKEVTVTINKADAVAATVTANNRTYDGVEKPLVTVDKSTLVGGTMYYVLGTDATTAPADNLYTTSIPAKTDAGT